MRQSGFTLLELSIVLVIIGLIIGGVFVGAEMVRQAQFQSVGKDVETYKTAVHTFALKFSALPGDMKNAQSYWPGCVNEVANPCNGDGSGFVGSRRSPAGNESYELYRGWQHLTLAGILPGSYTGMRAPADCKRGVNVPESRFPGALFSMNMRRQTVAVSPDATVGLVFGGTDGLYVGACATRGIVTPAEAQSLDAKFDDGMYETGNWKGDSQTPNCAEVNATGYALGWEAADCFMNIKLR